MEQNFDKIVKERRSVRGFLKNHKIDRELFLKIINEANQAPSFMNFQETRLMIVENESLKESMKPYMYNNVLQCETSSALVVVMSDLNFISKHEEIVENSIKLGYMTKEFGVQRHEIAKKMIDSNNITTDKLSFDAGAYSMLFQLVLRKYGYDSCVIGGFDYQKVAEILNINTDRYNVVCMIAVGIKEKEPRNSYRVKPESISEFK